MKRTQWIDVLRDIKKMKASFISICVISLLAVSAYLGIIYASEDMHRECSDFYNRLNFWDIEVSATRLLSKDDIEAIKDLDEVADAEGSMQFPGFVNIDGDKHEVTVVSLSDNIAVPEIVEGHLPETDGECAIEREMAEDLELAAGDIITLTDWEGNTVKGVQDSTYQISAIVHHPDHIPYDVPFTPYVLLKSDCFDMSLTNDCYVKGLVRLSGMPENRFIDEYYDAVAPVRQKVEDLADERCPIRDEELEKTEAALEMLPVEQREAIRQVIPEGECRWLVISDKENSGYNNASENAGNLVTLSLTLSLLFLAVAIMVIFACVSRLVEEQSVIVGGLKANGLYNHEILGKYIVFSLSAGIIGVVLGIIAAYFGLQKLILSIYSGYFVCGLNNLTFLPVPTCIAALCIPFAAALSGLFACTRMLRSTALELLKGINKTFHSSPRRSGRKRSLYSYLIIRNMRSSLKRVLVTIISVAGCCTLLMIGFNIYYALVRVADRQYVDIQTYDSVITFDSEVNPDAEHDIMEALKDKGTELLPVHSEDFIFRANGEQNTCNIICAPAGTLDGWFNVPDVDTGIQASPPDKGIMVGLRFVEFYNMPEDGEFTLYDSGMMPHKVNISGVFNNYLYEIMLCSPAAWKDIFGHEAVTNALFVKSGERSFEEITELTNDIPGFLSMTKADIGREMFESVADSSIYIAMIFILMAGLMAWFILMNLSDVYMLQKTQELKVMRINGFTVRECVVYAASEPAATTAIGILTGLITGRLLGNMIVLMLEQSSTEYARDLDWRALAFSALITIVFSLFINLLSLRQIKNIRLGR